MLKSKNLVCLKTTEVTDGDCHCHCDSETTQNHHHINKRLRLDVFRKWIANNIHTIMRKEVSCESRERYHFFGRVCPTSTITSSPDPSADQDSRECCYVSFPGRFQKNWESFISQKNLSIACVWIPYDHVNATISNLIINGSSSSSSTDNCKRQQQGEQGEDFCLMCSHLYGRRFLESGCLWFLYWIANVERARQLNQELVVIVCEPSFQVGKSQQLEIDWLELNGYEYRRKEFRNDPSDPGDLFPTP